MAVVRGFLLVSCVLCFSVMKSVEGYTATVSCTSSSCSSTSPNVNFMCVPASQTLVVGYQNSGNTLNCGGGKSAYIQSAYSYSSSTSLQSTNPSTLSNQWTKLAWTIDFGPSASSSSSSLSSSAVSQMSSAGCPVTSGSATTSSSSAMASSEADNDVVTVVNETPYKTGCYSGGTQVVAAAAAPTSSVSIASTSAAPTISTTIPQEVQLALFNEAFTNSQGKGATLVTNTDTSTVSYVYYQQSSSSCVEFFTSQVTYSSSLNGRSGRKLLQADCPPDTTCVQSSGCPHGYCYEVPGTDRCYCY
eukprot:TRINITY_DN570_c0_g1_i1.p1 TRINITY_DN570_c0_g1~~TRINITY_DN570_c0_g1_i1.p1  ORF type:complete len:303 (+),score=37.20 TRINITY_DN570_c0_g1_i1:1-909(+)